MQKRSNIKEREVPLRVGGFTNIEVVVNLKV